MDWRRDHICDITGPLQTVEHLSYQQAFTKPKKEITREMLTICLSVQKDLDRLITDLQNELK